MTSKIISLQHLKRFPRLDADDELLFETGVNVIVGRPNAGKTKWLRCFDFLMGDPDTPEDTLGEVIANKYQSIEALMLVGGEQLLISRRWHEKGKRTKIFVNDDEVSSDEFSSYFLPQLDIPVLRYPKGNRFSEATWPELSWRSLFRHIFRRERFWSDLADLQPEREQHACLMQFLGLAENLFPDELNSVRKIAREIDRLRSQKEQFIELLSEISREIYADPSFSVTPTADSLESAKSRILDEIASLDTRKLDVVASVVSDDDDKDLDVLKTRWLALQSGRDELVIEYNKSSERVQQLKGHRESVLSELRRLERAKKAGETLVTLKITMCPACHLELDHKNNKPNECELCTRPLLGERSLTQGERRMSFELDQLQEEQGELDQLIAKVEAELDDLLVETDEVGTQLRAVERELAPMRQQAAPLLRADLSLIDQKRGQLSERVAQLERIIRALKKRDSVNTQIQQLENQITAAEASIARRSDELNFDRAADLLSDGINTYLNELNRVSPGRWTQDPIRALLSDSSFQIYVGREKWSSKLGGTLRAYFLMGYHYALMRLTGQNRMNYPGLLILDFPVSFAEGETVADKENYILEPFIELCKNSKRVPLQVIAASRSFGGLSGVNKIELENVWA